MVEIDIVFYSLTIEWPRNGETEGLKTTTKEDVMLGKLKTRLAEFVSRHPVLASGAFGFLLAFLWLLAFPLIEKFVSEPTRGEKAISVPHCHYGWPATFVAIGPSKKLPGNSGFPQITLCPVGLGACEKKEQFTRFVDVAELPLNLQHKSPGWLAGKTTLCYLQNGYAKDHGLIFEAWTDKHDWRT